MANFMRITLFIIVHFLSFSIFSQDLYVNFQGDIYKVESDYTLNLIAVSSVALSDIAISPDNKLYGIRYDELFEIDQETGETYTIGFLPIGERSVTLVCDNNYRLFTLTVGGNLYSYNVLTGETKLEYNVGVSSPGDITFYKGNIVFQSSQSFDIMAFNTFNGKLTKLVCHQVPEKLWGIANVFNECGEEELYATGSNGNLFEIDVENNRFNLIADLDPDEMKGTIFGMASLSENLSSECIFNLDEINCNPYHLIKIYPVQDVVYIYSDVEIEEITVFSYSGSMLLKSSSGVSYLDVSGLATGVYIFSIRTLEEIFNAKVFIR